MPREFSRSQRMAEQIRRDLAEIVRDELKDPRMGLFSFTAIKLSRDLGNAVVYCAVLDEAEQKQTLDTLNRAAGFLRSRMAGRIQARTVPALKFVHDDSVKRGTAMENLIREAVESDAQHHVDDTDTDKQD